MEMRLALSRLLNFFIHNSSLRSMIHFNATSQKLPLSEEPKEANQYFYTDRIDCVHKPRLYFQITFVSLKMKNYISIRFSIADTS